MVDAGVPHEVFSRISDDDDEAGAESVVLKALDGLRGVGERFVLLWREEVGGGYGVDDFLDVGEDGGASLLGVRDACGGV